MNAAATRYCGEADSSGVWVRVRADGAGRACGKKGCSVLKTLGMVVGLGAMLGSSLGYTQELPGAVAQALNYRPEVTQAVYATAGARERVGSSMADFLPTINLRGTNGREGADNATTQATGVDNVWLNPKQRGIVLTQNLYRGFGTTHLVLSSQANARSAAWKVLEVSETIAMRAVDSYLNVMKNRGQILAAQESVASHKALLQLVQKRAESGAGTKADVSQTQARVKQAEAVLAQIQSTQDVADATFEALFGYPPKDLQEPAIPEGLVPKDRKEALKQALGVHPAIFSAQEAYFASKEQALSANSAFAPAVNLILTGNNDAHLAGSPGRSESMSAVVEMTVNAFSGYKDMHAKREATFNMAQAQSLLDKAVLDITENLANGYAALVAAQSRHELFVTQVQDNEKVRTAYFKQYRIGQRTLMDLLDVENELYSARNNLVVEHYQELAARFRVLSNMGQLLHTLSVEIPSSADPMTVDFFDSVRSLFQDADKAVDRWPAMATWLEKNKGVLRGSGEQKTPFMPGYGSSSVVKSGDTPEKKVSSDVPEAARPTQGDAVKKTELTSDKKLSSAEKPKAVDPLPKKVSKKPTKRPNSQVTAKK
ncbi:MAG: TolC family outer membrane protein [Nitrospirae bacterium]|nr:TolC family outer membrane protein [Magnetococcales bacterium]HAT50264.1 hypothetical protein [Alphaproteobacteria bacterium]